MTRMTPSEAFVETMVANGVTPIFGIMGSAFMDAMKTTIAMRVKTSLNTTTMPSVNSKTSPFRCLASPRM